MLGSLDPLLLYLFGLPEIELPTARRPRVYYCGIDIDWAIGYGHWLCHRLPLHTIGLHGCTPH
jgi:hypothetical protein